MASSPTLDLRQLAAQAMRRRGLEPEMPPAALAQAAQARAAPAEGHEDDLRTLPWCSIDNDDSRDLDQLTVAVELAADGIRLRVAVADVDAVVGLGSAVDRHAGINTTSIYTAGGMFPMLPERLSTDLTSLGPGEDRVALVVDVDVRPDGVVSSSGVRRAVVRNAAKLAYRGVGGWLDGGAAPQALLAAPGVAENLRLQAEATRRLREARQAGGALLLDTGESREVFRDGQVVDIRSVERNRAMDLIEDAMIAANQAVARFLGQHGVPSFRRVVRTPQHWDRLVERAAQDGTRLPAHPDARALSSYLRERRAQDPLRFPDLSLAVVKLLGRGEYVLEEPGVESGHFALAVRSYTHSTAPNRRYPDLIAQRQVKAALAGTAQPYSAEALRALAAHCTAQEDNAAKVERQLRKSAAALLLRDSIDQRFDAIVTGSASKGTWVRTLGSPAVEGRVVRGEHGMHVGDWVRVRLVSVSVEQGFIDFARA